MATNRGFTGHEHLERFNLIDMNGRVYDPVTAGFLSPDPFVANPYFSQSYNSYSYCVNNPLKFTDPSGYVPEGFSDPCRVPRNTRINPNHPLWDLIHFWDDIRRAVRRAGGDGPNEEFESYQRPDTYSSGDDGFHYPDSDPLMYSGGGSGAVSTSGQYQPSPTGVPRPVPYASGNGAYSIDNAINHLNSHAYSPDGPHKYGTGSCSPFVPNAINAGFGDNRIPTNLAGSAYGPSLLKAGFYSVYIKSLANYTPLKGDIAVMNGPLGGKTCNTGIGGICGHIQMYNGNQWVSDFFQTRPFWPSATYESNEPQLHFRIYRW
jgi:RHS repeat-associated protein